jgi:hypothetical protein
MPAHPEHNAVDKVFTYRISNFRFNHLRRSLTVIIKSEDRHAACPNALCYG